MTQRIITAIIAALIFLPIVFIGGIPFVILIYIMASICLFEILRMKKINLMTVPGILSLFLLWIFLLPINYLNFVQRIGLEGKTALFFLGVLIFLCYSFISKNTFSFEHIGYCLLSVLYIGIGF